MVCPCRYLSKGLLFNMQHKEGQKTRNFKLDRTANCHHLCSWTMPFSTNEVKSSWQQIPKTLNTHLFSLLCSPPPPYPLREKEGTENYCVYASGIVISLLFSPKNHRILREVTSGDYLVQPPTQAGTPWCLENWGEGTTGNINSPIF